MFASLSESKGITKLEGIANAKKHQIRKVRQVSQLKCKKLIKINSKKLQRVIVKVTHGDTNLILGDFFFCDVGGSLCLFYIKLF